MNSTSKNGWTKLLGVSVLITLLTNLYLIFMYAPTQDSMGHIQRIFYVHVPSAWVAGLAAFVVFIASIMYLWKRDRKYDNVAFSAAEIGVLFMTIFLITGPIWAKPVWNTWWEWSPRLTLSLVLWFIYVGYLMLRNFVEGEERSARFAAVFGIVGFVDVPFVYMSIRMWADIHPRPVIGGGEDSGMQPEIALTFYFSLFTFTLLFLFLLVQRIKLQKSQARLSDLRRELAY